MSFNWADEVEEELAGGSNHEQPSNYFAELPRENKESEEEANPSSTPQVKDRDVEKEPAASAAQPRSTPSPDAQPSARNSGIMQSRWATAPDEPAVNPESEVMKDAMLVEQGGNVTPSRSRRGRGVHSGKKERTQGGRSGSNSLTGSPRKSTRERNKHGRVKSTNAYDEQAPQPNTVVQASPQISGNSALTSAKDQPATTVASGIERKHEGPVQTPGSSPSKNEISLSMWA